MFLNEGPAVYGYQINVIGRQMKKNYLVVGAGITGATIDAHWQRLDIRLR